MSTGVIVDKSAMTTLPTAANQDSSPARQRFPAQVKFIIGNEACERFSYYGMLSILTLYLKNGLKLGDSHATEIVHLFATLAYFLPLFGAWLADRWWGRYKTILIISLFYCLGHGCLALFEGKLPGILTGLVLIAIGAGGIKPCVSAFVGDQFVGCPESYLTKIYGFFFWSINLGAFFGFALIPLVRDRLGYGWAFGVPGIFMALATLVFWLGSRSYIRQPPSRESGESGLLKVWAAAWTHRGQRKPGQSFFDPAVSVCGPESVRAMKAFLGVAMVFSTIPVFWALFNQVNTTWVIQGEKMTPFEVLHFKVDGERMQSFGSLLVMIWVPLLTLWIYPAAERAGLRPTPLRRIGLGMVLAAAAFFISGWIQARLDHGESLSLAWQTLPYVILEAGEVLVSATALEFAFAEAPPS
ncbi:MAG TPA: MFS transporter, partial [Candidatus Limnocylindria bacterium]|nr:MFS transporter [Candidatus Limnocylindria bacterium]